MATESSVPGPASASTSTWVPRRELALPNELLHKIILWVLCDSVHSICVSTEDTTWEKNVMATFHQVSPAFRAISSEIAGKAFDLVKDVRNNDTTLLNSLREIFVYLGLLGARFRHPTEWGGVSFQTIDCSASSFVFAYALFLSCITLRRNASRSPHDVFESTHKVILTALLQSTALCERVKPVEMTALLKKSIEEESVLAIHGLAVVEGFNQLDSQANSYVILEPHAYRDGTGPITAVRSMIHTALLKIEGSYQQYDSILSNKPAGLEPQLYELPGVFQALRKVAVLTFEEDDYDLYRRIQKLVNHWSVRCPFLNKSNAPIPHSL
ncbi:hypothetical protein CPB83DRAFT_853835 [Crepidotus variabilis]|uniref:Uncharacterized protein n=1 Tax=Crepidotus variabilis TaxID=179855 RepID=A0A9P6EGU3_9AGAR|nr:hypothetical protein CPB83DRAFT_853835 [Crepidotus variabilis]